MPYLKTFLCLALVLAAAARAEVKVGDVFPAVTSAGLAPLSAEVPAIDGKVVLIDFWASWCAPCKASFPMMAKLHREFAARGLVVLAISVDEKAAAAAAFARKQAPPFVTVHDRDSKLVQKVEVPAMPTSYLVGRDGRVRFIHVGFHADTTERDLRKQIETLLAEKN